MKKLQLIKVALFSALLPGCKKERTPKPEQPVCIERCDYVTNFVNHRWRQIGEYEDSSNYALNNIGLLPLPTSYSFSFDSCDLDNEWIINANGTSYGLNHSKCQSSEQDTFEIPDWRFSDDRKMMIFSNASTLYIESITSSYMKFYYYFYIDIPGKGPTRYVGVQHYKSI